MIFNNPHKIQIFDSFLSKFGGQIDALWPQVKNLKLQVIDTNNWSPILSDNFPNYTPEKVDDTPFYTYLNFHTGPYNAIHFIGTNDGVASALNMSTDEMYALIMHEIGHAIAYVDAGCRPIWSTDINEEFFPDDCAKAIGLGNEIKSVLDSMSKSSLYSADKQSTFITRRDCL